MRRRLDLAASLITRPPLIFLDEPTTGLDPRTRGQMWETIRELVREGCTVLLTTQYLDEADQLADRIAVIDRGRKVAEGTPDELKTSVGGSSLQLRLVDRGDLDAAAGVVARGCSASSRCPPPRPAAHRRPDRRATGGRRADRPAPGGHRHRAASVAKPTLDEVFLALTGHGADDDATRPTTTEETPMTALRSTTPPRPPTEPGFRPDVSLRDTVEQTHDDGLAGHMKMRRNLEQLFDVTIQPLLFTAMFACIFGGAISGSVDGLPAAASSPG